MKVDNIPSPVECNGCGEEETLGSLSADVAVGAMLDDENPLVGSCADQRAFGNAEEIT